MPKKTKNQAPKPMMLVVMDGWGVAQDYSGNAITQAKTPILHDLISRYPAMTLRASGEAVGLPWGEVGNSEVGHMNMGLGRIVYQDLPRINNAISDGSFFNNEALTEIFEHVKTNDSKLHIMGIVSNGCVHGSIDHLFALLASAKERGITNVFVHAFLDGRDTAFNSGEKFIADLERFLAEQGCGRIATVSGRFYAMDRNNNWDRIAKTYMAMVEGAGNRASSAKNAISESYKKKLFDEEFVPTVVVDANDDPVAIIEDNDGIIFFNYRADRARQLTRAFCLPSFDRFTGWKKINNLKFVSFTRYEKDLPVGVAFAPESKENSLGEVISKAGFKQLRIAETEKYAHVTYFFNGGIEEKSANEENFLISSPQVPSYDQKPEMSAREITDQLVSVVEDEKYDFILVNFANADMVGHTGNMEAAVKAVETVDKCIGRLAKSVLSKNGVLLITADHGNAECMFNMQTGTIDKEHTSNPVPFVVVGNDFEGISIGSQDAISGDLSLIQPQGVLSDIAPTILEIMGIEQPPQMTGHSLL